MVHLARSNPSIISIHQRERLLDELDVVISARRRLHDKEGVKALLDAAFWVSKWPVVGNMDQVLNRKENL